jgi:hypothetical protein
MPHAPPEESTADAVGVFTLACRERLEREDDLSRRNVREGAFAVAEVIVQIVAVVFEGARPEAGFAVVEILL